MTLELTSLKKSIASLEKVIHILNVVAAYDGDHDNEIEAIQSGVIQNFEVAYEQCWKFMKRWIEENINAQEVDGVPRRELFRVSAENNLILDVDEWMEFHRARNLTSHTYNVENAATVFKIALKFLPKAKEFLQQLEKRNA